MSNDYKTILRQAMEEFDSLLKERQELDLKIAQKEQFIRATMYQLPDAERKTVEDWFNSLNTGIAGLSVSIRKVLASSPKKFHTATEVRDALVKQGFDFGNYSSNPLASVHSSLKRLKPEEVETTTIDGVMAWRAKEDIRIRRHRRVAAIQSPANPFAGILAAQYERPSHSHFVSIIEAAKVMQENREPSIAEQFSKMIEESGLVAKASEDFAKRLSVSKDKK